jgi:hypothetical protein
MILIQDSKDLLLIVIAFCVLWLTIFTAWFIYYLAMITRQVFQIIKDVRRKLEKVDEVIETAKQKIEHSATYVALIGDGIKKIVELMKDRNEKKNTKKKK